MYIFRTVAALKSYVATLTGVGQTIGFVPTMGALHDGHLSLIRRSNAQNSVTICSIFVNPTQFNQGSDLEKYPRTPGKDIGLLLTADCEVLFLPDVAEIYPPGLDTRVDIDLSGMIDTMEGAFRPGHFQGVVQAVNRLLRIVSPHHLYMGQKDLQQTVIVRHLIQTLGLPVELRIVPTKREEDGLAMSSRNQQLTATGRQQAPAIYRTLRSAREQLHQQPLAAIKTTALEQLTEAGLRPEYFTIIDGDTLQEIESVDGVRQVVACTAAWAGEVRLIDNLVLA